MNDSAQWLVFYYAGLFAVIFLVFVLFAFPVVRKTIVVAMDNLFLICFLVTVVAISITLPGLAFLFLCWRVSDLERSIDRLNKTRKKVRT